MAGRSLVSRRGLRLSRNLNPCKASQFDVQRLAFNVSGSTPLFCASAPRKRGNGARGTQYEEVVFGKHPRSCIYRPNRIRNDHSDPASLWEAVWRFGMGDRISPWLLFLCPVSSVTGARLVFGSIRTKAGLAVQPHRDGFWIFFDGKRELARDAIRGTYPRGGYGS